MKLKNNSVNIRRRIKVFEYIAFHEFWTVNFKVTISSFVVLLP